MLPRELVGLASGPGDPDGLEAWRSVVPTPGATMWLVGMEVRGVPAGGRCELAGFGHDLGDGVHSGCGVATSLVLVDPAGQVHAGCGRHVLAAIEDLLREAAYLGEVPPLVAVAGADVVIVCMDRHQPSPRGCMLGNGHRDRAACAAPAWIEFDYARGLVGWACTDHALVAIATELDSARQSAPFCALAPRRGHCDAPAAVQLHDSGDQNRWGCLAHASDALDEIANDVAGRFVGRASFLIGPCEIVDGPPIYRSLLGHYATPVPAADACPNCHGTSRSVDLDGTISGTVGATVVCSCTGDGDDQVTRWRHRELRHLMDRVTGPATGHNGGPNGGPSTIEPSAWTVRVGVDK